MTYDSDAAFRDSRTTWLKVGHALRKQALERAETGHETLAIKTARCADFCFWQATGEGDCSSWSDFFVKPSA